MKTIGKVSGISGVFVFLLLFLIVNPSAVLAQRGMGDLPEKSEKAIFMPCSSDFRLLEALILAHEASRLSDEGKHLLSINVLKKAEEKLEQAEQCLDFEPLAADERKSKRKEIKEIKGYVEELEEIAQKLIILEQFRKELKKEIEKQKKDVKN